MWHCVDTSSCLPLPSGGYRGRSCRKPCGLPPSSVLWAHTTARRPFPATSGLPWRQVLHVEGLFASRETPSFPSGPGFFGLGRTAPSSGEVGCSPGFTGSPLESMPRARDSGDPRATSPIGCLDAAFRYPNGVGVAMMSDVGAESSRPASLLCTLRTRRSPNERQHSLPVGPLRL
jgi:hypothetical protein